MAARGLSSVILLLCLTSIAVAGEVDFMGQGPLGATPWRGTIEPIKSHFNTRLDGSSGNNRISLLIDQHPDKRVVGYRIHYGTTTGVYTQTHDCRKTLETGCTISGLTNGTTYYFVATAYARGWTLESGYSNEVSGEP